MTTIYYKLTRPDGTTHGGCQWGEGVQHITNGEGDLCGPGWTHWYTDPLLAVLLDPIHANFGPDALLWEGDNEGGQLKEDHGLKVGITRGRTLRQIEMPKVTHEQRIAFGILCALEVYKEPRFTAWTGAWLDGTDRSAQAARAEEAAEAAALAAARAEEAVARAVALSAARAAARAEEAAEAAARAAEEAASRTPIDLISLARKAVRDLEV